MKREIDMNEISDGRLYGLNDMVKVGCNDCEGCSACCQGMGRSVILDPLDVYRLSKHLNCAFEQLMQDKIELNVVDGVILPNLKMTEPAEKCAFLNEEGRCSIHEFRPGFCRLFPLGRNYEDNKLTYFVLKDVCPAPNKSKVKINKWLNIPNLKAYEKFLVEWHSLTKMLRAYYEEYMEDEAVIKAVNMKFLQIFYLLPYEEDDFYIAFQNRMTQMNMLLETLGIAE